MRNGFRRVNCIFHALGNLLQILGLILLFPLIPAFIYWGQNGDGKATASAFVIASAVSFTIGRIFRYKFKAQPLDITGSMLICALGWLLASAIGALPFILVLDSGFLDSFFEAMSGFTTTGITVFSGLDNMPPSILFWRALTQWLGGIGILSFFLMIISEGGGAHYMFGAESHKISSGRPAPGLFNTLRILWAIYAIFTILAVIILTLEKMPPFDAVCHALTTLSTGGFSPHDSSIAFYRLAGHPHYRLIEYTLIFFMMLGGINFLVHYRVLNRDIKALWDNIEVRYWWKFIAAFTVLIVLEHLHRTGGFAALFTRSKPFSLVEFEQAFRDTLFQVMSILTTTGFATNDIGSDFFGTMAKQLFLVMMVVGGCVGSTSGGFKVLRVAILNRLMVRELFKLRTSGKASAALVIDKRTVPEDEIHRIGALFFTWMALILVGGAITALLSSQGPLKSLSGMFSAVGNIGPCYISGPDMIAIHPVVK
ncbi:MAG: TrkH family potassium uptake protein, partial [Planctomycetota bacterium]